MSSAVSLEYYNKQFGTSSVGFTTEGGFYQTFINNTGTSVKGTIVIASTTIDNGVDVAPANTDVPMGVIYEDGIANGSPVKVVTYGKAQVLLVNGQPSTRGYWCEVSGVAGRMVQQISPTPLDHYQEIGHSLESKTSGTNVLSLVQIHFN